MSNFHHLSVLFCVIWGFLSAHGRHIPEVDLLSIEELKEYSRDGSAIQEFDIISPQFISHGVFKRSTESLDSNHPSIKEVQYDAFDTSYSLELNKNDWLVRKGLQIEILKADGTIERKPVALRDCHYFGTIAGQENSAAAISLCNGMRGMISHNDTDFVVQPLKDHHANRVRSRRHVEHPHIIYKRSTSRPPERADEPVQTKHQPFCSYEAPVGYHPTSMPFLARSGPKSFSQTLPYIGQKYMELFVVADKDMVEFHGNDTEDYIFSLMNIVSRRYADPSLDVTLRIHIVKLMLLQTDSPTLHSSSFDVTGSSRTLDDFCAWQAGINPFQDSHPEHWDNAILLTRKNIYTSIGNGNDYSLLGKAYLSSTCRSGLQCSYNQDDGLGSSLVIAHETGHTLGLNHDDDYGCMSGVNIMSSWRPAGPDSFTWSECSRQNIRTFLGGPVATCLNDVPSNSPLPIAELVGASYDLDEQCSLALGPGATTCQNNFVNCGYLRCRNSTGCFSLGVGVMDGTSCGKEQWCLSGSCVEKEPLPNAVNGGWSDWGAEYGECSRTCGGGVRMRRRFCNSPSPLHGGRSCDGSAEQYQACNLQPCESSQDEFRDEQCSHTDAILFNGNNYTWRAFISGQIGDDLCTKKCLSSSNFWATRPPYRYIDGTRCWHDDSADINTLKLCVSGKCQRFGCDGVEGSRKVFDVCRHCHGDGSTCEQVTGRYDGGRYRKHTTFLELPVGATSVEIINVNLAYTHMAVSSGSDTVFQGYLFTPPTAGRYGAGSDIIIYSTDFRNFREAITIEGPLSVPLTVEVYLLYDPQAIYGVNIKPKISYRYHVPKTEHVYEWLAGQYSSCSVTCAEGVQTRRLRCAEIVEGRPLDVDEHNCDQASRPPSTIPCDEGVCPAPSQWMKGQWSECDVECGEGLQMRVVHCQKGDVITPNECNDEPPRDNRKCFAGECLPIPEWVTGTWSECGVTCGNGNQERSVECRRGDSITPNDCDISIKPPNVTSCEAGPCPEWVTGQWEECDVLCGIGTQQRRIECRTDSALTEGACENLIPPSESRICDAGECIPPAEWLYGPWGECNADCGFGTKYRLLTCQRGEVKVHKSECDRESKPKSKSPCQHHSCELPATWITGQWTSCDVSCGVGNERRFVGCLQGTQEVTDDLCDSLRRPNGVRTCTRKLCPPEWKTGQWSECSVTCGDGIQARHVTCERNGNEVTNKNCIRDLKPSKTQRCNTNPCPEIPAEWVAGDWTECSTTCGEGTRERFLQCRRGNDLTPDECDEAQRPVSTDTCSLQQCPPQAIWTASSWSECTETCGGGTQTRDLRCQRGNDGVADSECPLSDAPETRRECNNAPCPTLPPATWVTGDWSQCDSSCGQGIETRSVTCERNGEQAHGACANIDKPSVERSCDNGPCGIGSDVNPEDEVCNQLLTAPAGAFTQSHPTGENGCITTLVAPFGKSFSLRINSLIDCSQGEYLRIMEGTYERRVCGQKSDYILNFRDNVISVEVKTVSSNNGYALSFERRDGRPSNRCDRLFLNPTGTIKTPAYPRRYPSNADCRYRIVTTPGKRIRLSFSRFSMQGHYPTCRYDKLEITDILGQTELVYCGTRNQLSTQSTGNDVLLRLRTDGRSNFSGFRATYSVVR